MYYYGDINNWVDLMVEKVPVYKIKYLECQEKMHEGEKANIVCFNEACLSNPLICSLCTSEKHAKHDFKPLKFYLDELYRQNKNAQNQSENLFSELEKKKNLLLLKLKECVETISEEFMILERDIIQHYEVMRSQIMEKEGLRNNFQEFYIRMIQNDFGDSNFQIKNYLRFNQIKTFTDDKRLQVLTNKFSEQIKTIRQNLLMDEEKKTILSNVVNINQITSKYLIPTSISSVGNNFTQTDLKAGAPSLCLINFPLNEFANKMRITINQLGVGAKFTLGIMEKEVFQKMNFIKGDLQTPLIASDGSASNVNYSHLGVLSSGSVIDIFIKKDALKLVSKGSACLISLAQKKHMYIFFALEGHLKISIAYPYTK